MPRFIFSTLIPVILPPSWIQKFFKKNKNSSGENLLNKKLGTILAFQNARTQSPPPVYGRATFLRFWMRKKVRRSRGRLGRARSERRDKRKVSFGRFIILVRCVLEPAAAAAAAAASLLLFLLSLLFVSRFLLGLFIWGVHFWVFCLL